MFNPVQKDRVPYHFFVKPNYCSDNIWSLSRSTKSIWIRVSHALSISTMIIYPSSQVGGAPRSTIWRQSRRRSPTSSSKSRTKAFLVTSHWIKLRQRNPLSLEDRDRGQHRRPRHLTFGKSLASVNRSYKRYWKRTQRLKCWTRSILSTYGHQSIMPQTQTPLLKSKRDL